MKKLIEKIKTKPDHVKAHIVLATTCTLTGLVIVFWVMNFNNEFAKPGKKIVSDGAVKPFVMLKDDFIKTFKNVSTGLGQATQNIKTGLIESEKKQKSSQEEPVSNEATQTAEPTIKN